MKKPISAKLVLILFSFGVILASCSTGGMESTPLTASATSTLDAPTVITTAATTVVRTSTMTPPSEPMATPAPQVQRIHNPAGIRSDGVYVDQLLREVMDEQGITNPPLAGEFPEDSVETVTVGEDAIAEINDLFSKRGWGDGLPIIPPTEERVQEMLNGTDLPADWVLGELQPMGGQATVEKIAVNAVMAGCRPQYMPILIAAVEAIMEPDFDQLGVATTTNPDTYMLIVSGPIVEKAGLNSGTNALGRGAHDNPSIGRAFQLVIQNVGGSWPGVNDMSSLGHPGDFAMLLPENEERTPWTPVRMDLGFSRSQNAVTVLAVSGSQNIISIGMTKEQFLQRVADLLVAGGIRQYQSMALLIIPPDVAAEFHEAGWTKDAIRGAVVEYSDMPDFYKDQLIIVVSGGPGEKNQLLPNWLRHQKAVSKEIRLPADWESLLEETSQPQMTQQ